MWPLGQNDECVLRNRGRRVSVHPGRLDHPLHLHQRTVQVQETRRCHSTLHQVEKRGSVQARRSALQFSFGRVSQSQIVLRNSSHLLSHGFHYFPFLLFFLKSSSFLDTPVEPRATRCRRRFMLVQSRAIACGGASTPNNPDGSKQWIRTELATLLHEIENLIWVGLMQSRF